jgi:Domain of unknown function (DUF4062)
VFISHTSDMADWPQDLSFVQGAMDAVLRTAGFAPVDMGYFAARDEQPVDFCFSTVRDCDVYVGLVGLRYGSLVPGGNGLSYTELEYRTAADARIPRPLFLLDEETPLPRRLVDGDSGRIDGFRERLLQR